MIIEVPTPIFKCESDEALFLARLRELPGCEKVRTAASHLRLEMSNPTDESIEALREICDTWNTTFSLIPAESASNAQRMKVYYNSACPVCKAGIEGQMGKSSICEIQWLDVHSDNQKVAEVGADLEYVRKRLHAVDANGNLQVGFNAFLAIWRNSPNETWKARLLGLPLIKPFCEASYNLFAAALYKWNRAKKHW